MSDALIGKLVNISGLQSEAGAPLNGSIAIVLDDPKFVAKQPGRLPVLIYALRSKKDAGDEGKGDAPLNKGNEYAILESPGKMRGIKEENLACLEDQTCGLYKKFAFTAWEKAFRFDGEIDSSLFHLKQYTERWPDDYKMTVNYVTVLRQKALLVHPFQRAAAEKASAIEAWKALCRTEPFVTNGSFAETEGELNILRGPAIEEGSTHVNQFYIEMVAVALDTEQEPQVALDWALKMNTDSAQDKKLAREALEKISTRLRCRSRVNVNKADMEVNVRAMKALLEFSPDDPELIGWVAGAECMAGNNQEGAKWYRKALELGDDCRHALSLAQMQCPNGPLEEYKVLNVQNGKWTCLHESKAEDYIFEEVHSGLRVRKVRADAPPIEEVVEYFPIPDPDDKVAFGAAQF